TMTMRSCSGSILYQRRAPPPISCWRTLLYFPASANHGEPSVKYGSTQSWLHMRLAILPYSWSSPPGAPCPSLAPRVSARGYHVHVSQNHESLRGGFGDGCGQGREEIS